MQTIKKQCYITIVFWQYICKTNFKMRNIRTRERRRWFTHWNERKLKLPTDLVLELFFYSVTVIIFVILCDLSVLPHLLNNKSAIIDLDIAVVTGVSCRGWSPILSMRSWRRICMKPSSLRPHPAVDHREAVYTERFEHKPTGRPLP